MHILNTHFTIIGLTLTGTHLNKIIICAASDLNMSFTLNFLFGLLFVTIFPASKCNYPHTIQDLFVGVLLLLAIDCLGFQQMMTSAV
jgi:hypothetical protein